ncbi:potassium channel family protein [Paenisporosarcina sp.]|uniref:potassium channel family protein n=1 Tax=Paenisporosarcina sp. TaxID=1932001 RepID=UPI003C745289
MNQLNEAGESMNTSKWMDLRIRFRHILFAIIGLIVLVAVATAGFMALENLKFFDAFYLTIISLMTVGYGDIVPETEAGQKFALLLIPLGVAFVTYAMGAVASYFIEHQLSVKVWNKRMEHTIKNLEDHIVVCGLGRVGRQVYEQLKEEDVPVIYIHDSEEEMVEYLEEGTLRIVGSPLQENILKEANVAKARGLIATLPSDSDNVFITIKAKALNEKIEVVARAENAGSEEVLLRAGASRVINPSTIGGRELVSSVLRPEGTDLVNLLIHTKEKKQSLEEVSLEEACTYIGKSLKESAIRNEMGVTVLAIRRGEKLISNPSSDEVMKKEDVLIIYGEKDTSEAFKKKCKG